MRWPLRRFYRARKSSTSADYVIVLQQSDFDISTKENRKTLKQQLLVHNLLVG